MRYIAVAAALCLFLSLPSYAVSKDRKGHKKELKDVKISVPTNEELAAVDRMTTLMAEYGPVSVMVRNQKKIVEDSSSLFIEKAIPPADCAKMLQSASTSYEVLLIRSGRINDEFLKNKMAENIKYLIAGNTAYMKYYKGDMAARAEAEKQWLKADTCDSEMRKYIEGKK